MLPNDVGHKVPAPEAGVYGSGIDKVKSLPTLGPIPSRPKGGSPGRRRNKITQDRLGRDRLVPRPMQVLEVLFQMWGEGEGTSASQETHVVQTSGDPFLLPHSMAASHGSMEHLIQKTFTAKGNSSPEEH